MTRYHAIITGGSRGIGADLAQRLLALDYHVTLIDRQTPDTSTMTSRCDYLPCDLLDPQAIAATAKLLAKRGKISHLIHNAGAIRANPIASASTDDIAALAQLHLGAALTLLQAVLPDMQRRHFGRIILNSSRAALGMPTRTAYSATKAGMIGMARSWALELAASGITVNVVAPGPIQTDNFWALIPKGSEQEAALAQRIPLRRLGTVADVSRAMLFFCDPENSFITGQTLYVCGGASISSLSL